MGTKRILSWIVQELLGPAGKVIGAAEAIISKDDVDEIDQAVKQTSQSLNEILDKVGDGSHLRAIADKKLAKQVAANRIMKIHEGVLDSLATREAQAIQRGDEKSVRQIRAEREDWETQKGVEDARAVINEIDQAVKQTSQSLNDILDKVGDGSHLRAIADKKLAKQVAASQMMEIYESMLDSLAAREAQAIQRGDEKSVRQARSEREDVVAGNRENIEHVKRVLKQRTHQYL